MNILAVVLLVIGSITLLVGAILQLIAAFRVHIGWGLGSLFVPVVPLIFLFARWEDAKASFLVSLFGGLTVFGSLYSFGNAGVMHQVHAAIAQRAATAGQASTQGNPSPGMKASAKATASQKVAAKLLGAMNGSATASQELSLDEIEGQLRVAQTEVAALQKKLAADFESLKARKEKLGTDKESIEAFNADAATYKTENEQLAEKVALVSKLREDAEEATQEELAAARAAKGKGGKKPSPLSSFFGAPKKAAAAATAAKATMRGEVIMYTTKTCPACKAAKEFLAKRHVDYREVDVESDASGMQEFRRLGGTGVPLIVVNGETMHGFDQRRLESML